MPARLEAFTARMEALVDGAAHGGMGGPSDCEDAAADGANGRVGRGDGGPAVDIGECDAVRARFDDASEAERRTPVSGRRPYLTCNA